MKIKEIFKRRIRQPGGVLHIQTELIARKKVLDKNGVYQYTGDDRHVVNKLEVL